MVMGSGLGCFYFLWILKLLDYGNNICLNCFGKIKVKIN